MKYNVLQRFLTKSGIYIPGDVYENPNLDKFTKDLITYGFIEKTFEKEKYLCWERDGIRSKLTGLIVAPEDYQEGDKKHFTYDEALEIEKKLNNGWRLPTRSELVLLVEEFGQDAHGQLNTTTIMKNLKLTYTGRVDNGSHGYTTNGYWWSRTAYDSNYAYYLYGYSSYVFPGTDYSTRYNGFAVRLVKEV